MRPRLPRDARLDRAIGIAVFFAMSTPSPRSEAQAPSLLADAVSLQALLAHAETHAPLMRRARAQLGYAEASETAAGVLLQDNPTVAFGIGPRVASLEDETDFDFFVSLEQRIELSGARGRRLEAATQLGERFEAALAHTRELVRYEVALAFEDSELAAHEMEIAASIVRYAEASLAIVQRRLAAGDTSAIELRLAETELAEAQLAALEATQSRQSAVCRLIELTGWPSSAALTLAGTTSPAGTSFAATEALPSLESLQQFATLHHPRLREAESAKLEARALATVAEREAWPTPAMGLELHREGAAGDAASYTVLGTLSLELPIWQQNQGARAHAIVDLEVASADQEALKHTLLSRLSTAYARLTSERARIELFESRLSAPLTESVDLVQRGFEAGELPLHEAIFTRNRLAAFQRDRFRAYASYQRARAELEYAIGARLSEVHTTPTPRGEP